MKKLLVFLLLLQGVVSAQVKKLAGPAIDRYLKQEVDAGRLKGVHTLVAKNGVVVYNSWYGLRDAELAAPMKGNELHFIQSMTKPIISAALMMLYEEGKFKLDDPIAQYLPEFADVMVINDPAKGSATAGVHAAARNPTIAQLLSHTSGMSHGLTSVAYDQEIAKAGYDGRHQTIADRVRRLAGMPLMYEPGTKWNYSFGPDVLSRLIEVLSGTTTDLFLRDRLFGPLGMQDTYYNVPADKADRIMTVYDFRPDSTLIRAPVQPRHTGNTIFAGINALFATGQDYLKFAQMLANGGSYNGKQLLKPATVALMTRDFTVGILKPEDASKVAKATTGIVFDQDGSSNLEPGHGFGLGFAVLNDPAKAGRPAAAKGEFFWSGANSTHFFINPKLKLVTVFMTQIGWYSPNPYHYYYSHECVKQCMKILAGDAYQEAGFVQWLLLLLFNKVFCMIRVLIIVSMYLLLSGIVQPVHAQVKSVAYGSNAAAAKRVRVDDVTIYLELYGKGVPLILLHGNGGSIENFESLIPEFARHYQVVAIDSRMQGRSTYSKKELTYALMAQDVAAVMDSLNIDSAHFVGWSDGANVILELALIQPRKIRKAVLMGANYTAENAFLPNDALVSLPKDDELRVRSAPTWHKYLTGMQRLAPDTTKLTQARKQLSQLMARYPNITTQQLQTIQVPMLVMAGDHDLFTIDHTISLYRHLPKANLFIVHNASHLVPLEFSDLVASEVLRYLQTKYRAIDPYYFIK